MTILYLPLLVLVALLAIALRNRLPLWTRSLYYTLLILAILPYGLHATNSLRYASTALPEPLLAQPGVLTYAVLSSVAILSLLIAAGALVRRKPLATALLPACAWVVYWYACLPFIYRALRGVSKLDNLPNVWLFAATVFATLLLAGTALVTYSALKRG